MTTINYILVGILGTMLAVALYAARVDFALGGQQETAPAEIPHV